MKNKKQNDELIPINYTKKHNPEDLEILRRKKRKLFFSIFKINIL